MTRICLIVLAATLLSGLFLGCRNPAPSEEEQKVDAYIPVFNYTPPAQATPGSAGVNFLLFNVSDEYKTDSAFRDENWFIYQQGEKWVLYDQFKSLGNGMGQGFLNLLTAKGFTVRGPFDSYDNIPFPDKKSSDLILIPTIEFSLNLLDAKFTPNLSMLHISLNTYNYTGKFVLSGKVNLVLRETTTRELMWAKSIEIPKIELPYNITSRSGGSLKYRAAYNGILNDVAKAIEKQYPTIMETVGKYLDPEEMRLVKKQAQELKEKK